MFREFFFVNRFQFQTETKSEPRKKVIFSYNWRVGGVGKTHYAKVNINKQK